MTRAAWVFLRCAPGARERLLLEAAGRRWRPLGVDDFKVEIATDDDAGAAAVFAGVHISAHVGVCAALDSPCADPGGVGDAIGSDASVAVRATADTIEVVVATPARRAVWVCFDKDRLLVSTSQRAMAVLLGGFDPSHEAASWMLSAGNLGPCAWDRRVQRLESGSRLRLHRPTWSVTKLQDPAPTSSVTLAGRAAALRGAVMSALEAVPAAGEGWCLPLSGGVDSRALATLLARMGKSPRCITWASRELAAFADGDLAVARRVGEALGLQVDEEVMTSVNVEDATKVFVAESEGRVDHIGGYLDGFGLWGCVASGGNRAIVRGDEVMGWVEVVDERDVLRSVEATRLCELDGVEASVIADGARQVLPASLHRVPGESLPGWRDRLYRGYRVPAVVSALSDAKAAFVDTWSPLLSRQVVGVALALTDRERTEKRLFRSMAKETDLGIPYASRSSVVGSRAVLGATAFMVFARQVLEQGLDDHVLPPSWVALGERALRKTSPSAAGRAPAAGRGHAVNAAKHVGRRLLPFEIRKALWRRRHGTSMPMEKVPLRLVLMVLANALLRDDGAAGARVLR